MDKESNFVYRIVFCLSTFFNSLSTLLLDSSCSIWFVDFTIRSKWLCERHNRSFTLHYNFDINCKYFGENLFQIIWKVVKKENPLTASQHSKSTRNTAHLSHLSKSRASFIIFLTRHSRLFCSSKILLAKFNKIWFRLYSRTLFSNNWAFCIPALGDWENRIKKIRKYINRWRFSKVCIELWNFIEGLKYLFHKMLNSDGKLLHPVQ